MAISQLDKPAAALHVAAGSASAYIATLAGILEAAKYTDANGAELTADAALAVAVQMMRQTHDRGNKIMFIGNGGSAGICSHVATDYLKNGQLRTMTFNDSALITCLSNDLGYEKVFSTPIQMHARAGDLLVAISSSGQSPNILAAAVAAREIGCGIISLSGFRDTNPLRRLGDMNVYLPSSEYGFVEIGHLTFIHLVLDTHMGLAPQPAK